MTNDRKIPERFIDPGWREEYAAAQFKRLATAFPDSSGWFSEGVFEEWMKGVDRTWKHEEILFLETVVDLYIDTGTKFPHFADLKALNSKARTKVWNRRTPRESQPSKYCDDGPRISTRPRLENLSKKH